VSFGLHLAGWSLTSTNQLRKTFKKILKAFDKKLKNDSSTINRKKMFVPSFSLVQTGSKPSKFFMPVLNSMPVYMVGWVHCNICWIH